MLTRIIQASSKEGALILDCFCGSGTTAAVAGKLNRRWITCDLGRFSIHTTRKRHSMLKSNRICHPERNLFRAKRETNGVEKGPRQGGRRLSQGVLTVPSVLGELPE